MKYTTGIYAFLFALIALSSVSCSEKGGKDAVEEEVSIHAAPVLQYGIPVDSLEARPDKVRKGDYFAKIMGRLGFDNNEAYNISRACDGVYDLRKIKVGNSYVAYYEKEASKPSYWRYDADSRNYLVISTKDSLAVNVVPKELEVKTRYAEVSIENSLWYDVQQAGVSTQIALEIADVYQWTIDFFGLQKGDSFKVLYDEVMFEDEVLYIDKIRYCIFESDGTNYYAYWYDQKDGSSNRYWNEKGESLKKAFLKAPLKFSRISSGFTYARKHPITRVVRPHTGIDYAAPAGTPVMSIGDGVVIQRGYQGGGGNTVKIRHNSVYTSAYLHLSKYGQGIKAGARVKQGQIIGYVGSTGMSTGPHLDFRIWKNGTPINPLKMESPSMEPIKKENREEFYALVEQYSKYQEDMVVFETMREYLEPLCGAVSL